MSREEGIEYGLQEMIVPLPTGVSLEVDLIKPKGQSALSNGKQSLAVCLHPWSWLGGRKNDPVLGSLIDLLLEGNYHIIRYNSRGVGKSTGLSSFTGHREGEDLKALVQWALGQIGNVMSVVLIGYSYGSLIASLHPVLPAPLKISHVLLSYPLGPRGWLTAFRSSHYQEQLEGLLKDERSNVLVVYGDEDEFTGESSYKAWVDQLQGVVVPGSERLCVAQVRNGSHFWQGGSGGELERVLRGWLS